MEEERDGKRYQKLVDGGQIELSNFKTSGHGVHGRVSFPKGTDDVISFWRNKILTQVNVLRCFRGASFPKMV